MQRPVVTSEDTGCQCEMDHTWKGLAQIPAHRSSQTLVLLLLGMTDSCMGSDELNISRNGKATSWDGELFTKRGVDADGHLESRTVCGFFSGNTSDTK